ncbi:hypothetical protein DL766_010587 [Monosporascus sp. MC13-8B]|uniref:Prion-inhibition and propagation HeLo domain-containing protein n=1 Tax=Monosporascus cannonballus TaxID=155416 RepID=A0ABY0GX93_9PEZI|nr:hypothetical protein DL762_008074 [Monosporascus cannonballus]RYO84693.1 hypothetical protein DL763_007378 [Monosporascus cannonballus]RYP01946.1 hypothetical protein DL766_010587 [Monosporascus sp. MC13-8B]
MSGIEFIIGTTLASIPIALEAYDRSGRVFEVFKTFKRYPREVGLLEARLSSQKTIFRNNTIILLTAVTKDRCKVDEVLKQPSSPTARAGLAIASPYELQLESLDESFLACRQTAELVNNTLQQLCTQFEAFRAEVGEKDDTMTSSEWLKHVRTRFKLGLNKPQIGKAITELRDLNTDYDLITKQIVKSLQDILNEGVDNTVIPRKSARNLNLLNKLLNCASDPTKGKEPAHVLPYITCELSVTHDGSSYASKGPLRLEVEQAFLENNAGRFKVAAPAKEKSNIRNLFKGFRKDRQQMLAQPSNPTHLPRLTQSLATLQLGGAAHLTTATTTLTATALDLSLVTDFCRKSQEVISECRGRSLLGSWQVPHARWFCVPSTPQSTSQSLADMIHWIAEEPVLRSLPRPLLVELAGDVAEGLMNFYSTPWLTQANLGHNVRYINLAPAAMTTAAVDSFSAASSQQLEGPYFMMRVNDNSSAGQTIGKMPPTNVGETVRESEFTGARNKLLFNYGILLLEIGFGRPWHQLKQTVARTAEGGLSDYRAAEKLAQLLVRQMGLAYPKIIKKCLGCDFGLGETDLDNEDLQRRFVDDVVLGLQRLRENMRQMNLDPRV